jgi:hypothetical protein
MSSKKDNYLLPKMEHILHRVTSASMISMIDGFSSYNHIFVLPKDREKTSFTTPWGTFMYAKMPFGLMNARETFQRAMDISFIGEKDKFVVIYLDDITFFPYLIKNIVNISGKSSQNAKGSVSP